MTEGHSTFRYVIGILAIVGGFAGLIALYFVEVPTGNRDAVTLALGLVLGWGGTVISGEWGSSPAGRQMAQIGAEMTAGKPINANITNPPTKPVPTTDGPYKFPDADLGRARPDPMEGM